MKQVYGGGDGLGGGLSPEMGSVAGDPVQLSQRSVRAAYAKVGKHLAEIRGLLFEPGILLKNPVVTLRHMVQLVYEAVVLISQANNLRPQLIQVLLLPHPRSAGGFSIGYHPSLLPLIDDAELMMLLLLRLVRGGWWGELMNGGRDRTRGGVAQISTKMEARRVAIPSTIVVGMPRKGNWIILIRCQLMVVD